MVININLNTYKGRTNQIDLHVLLSYAHLTILIHTSILIIHYGHRIIISIFITFMEDALVHC